MALPEPITKTYATLIDEIEKGEIKIPQFQREFVWDITKSSLLIDSIIKGYPIGTFIFWRTSERLRSVRNIGGIDFKDIPDGDKVNYVLDGQQRMTSLYAIFKGAKIKRQDGVLIDYSNVFVRLDNPSDGKYVLINTDGLKEGSFIKLCDLIEFDFEIIAKFSKEYHKIMNDIKTVIQSFPYPVILLNNQPLDVATEVFTRINLGGKQLTIYEIMVAKTYDPNRDFDLVAKMDSLYERLSSVDYDTISRITILQCMATFLSKESTTKAILNLSRDSIINNWDSMCESIEMAIDYFRQYYRIPVSQLLPFHGLIVPFSYFFHRVKNRKPTAVEEAMLLDFFWRCSLGGRYSASLEARLSQDIVRIEKILSGTQPTYDWKIFITPAELIQYGYFSASRSFVKAILCLYAANMPLSFDNGAQVKIGNDWLRQANSKNYHHFFPKKSDAVKSNEWIHINNILNITIVDDYLNKRLIRAKSPSVYMKEYETSNSKFSETLKSHFITDLSIFGVLSDNLELFINNRAELVSKQLSLLVSMPGLSAGTNLLEDEQIDFALSEDAVLEEQSF